MSCRASDKCQKEKRKTINGDDLLWAMATLGFEDYIEPLKAYLMRYREVKFFVTSGPSFPFFTLINASFLLNSWVIGNMEQFLCRIHVNR